MNLLEPLDYASIQYYFALIVRFKDGLKYACPHWLRHGCDDPGTHCGISDFFDEWADFELNKRCYGILEELSREDRMQSTDTCLASQAGNQVLLFEEI